ncbi:hypothetical protein YTPLAS18_16460 [Nitrospira sp.]|nr:hypothetical protein YTPLAS18_16460 [Nitrospira sp.]
MRGDVSKSQPVEVGKRDVGGGGEHMPEGSGLFLTNTTCIGKRTEAETVKH